MCALAFRGLRLERITALANTRNDRSQVALSRLGFKREGVLRSFHRHGDAIHDVVISGLLRADWERSELAAVPVEIRGELPETWVVG